jgi:peptidoglycan-N-acetylglucosamine deacetylase
MIGLPDSEPMSLRRGNAVQAQAAGSTGLPFVSVVIPAYNEAELLPLCLDSIDGQDYAGGYEVIVVDNASTDSTARIARDRGVRVVHEDRRSPACARQRGAEVARGEIIAFIDADTQAPDRWLSTIVERFLREPRLVAVSGPYAYFDAGRIARTASYAANVINIIVDHLFRGVFNKGGALWGCNFAVRRAALFQAGGFDTSIKFYGEEYELSLRLKKVGRAVIIPRLVVLTSARRLKRLGVVTQYWNWVVDYFSVLFWYTPIPENLEDWPARAWQALVAGFSWRRVITSLRYAAVVSGLVWLNTGPLVQTAGSFVFVIDGAVLGTLAAYHGISPRSRFYGRVWPNGNRDHRRIALTFDDGPNEPYTSQALDILEQQGVKATFFLIGQNAERHPDVCRKIASAGHVIGNHSYRHRKSLCLSWGRAPARDIEQAHRAISGCAGVEPLLFRPPYGYRTPWLMRAVRRLGYTAVTWDNMTGDWQEDKPVEDIVGDIVRRARPGGVIVLHDGRGTRAGYDRSRMLQALPRIIEALKSGGFDFVTIPGLIGSEGEPAAR